ncbi:MAG: BatD family protein [Rhizobacter sp.]
MTTRRPHAIGLIAACLCSSVLCGTASAAVTASADRTHLEPGDTVELTLQSDRGGSGQPDLKPLEKDFEILRRGTSNSLQIINGSASSQRQVRLTLSPRRNGRIEVPRLAWDGEQSAVIELIVAAGHGGKGAVAGSVADVFFTTTLDSLQPHVQSAVSLQLRLYSDKKLYQASVDFPGNTDLLVRRVGQDVTTDETRNGRTYQVITRSFVLVPQRSGEIELAGPVLNAQVADGTRSLDPFMEHVFGQLQIEGGASGTRALRLRGDPVRLAAKARPAGMSAGDWLPAQQLTIEEAWLPQGGPIAVGVPVTRRLRVSASGLGSSQLPDLGALMKLPSGLTSHPDEPKLNEDVQDGHIVADRQQDVVVLADRAGRFELPALKVDWWDVTTNQRREAVLAARTLEVAPAASATPTLGSGSAAATSAAASVASTASAPPRSTSRAEAPTPVGDSSVTWAAVGQALGLIGLGTLGIRAWMRRRRLRPGGASAPIHANGSAAVSASAAKREFQRACLRHDARPARDALLAWARATWPESAPPGLNALARHLDRADVTPWLQALDRACLEGTAWNGEGLARALPLLDGNRKPTKAPTSLPGLYGEQDARTRTQ